MRFNDTHCDYLFGYKEKKHQSSIKLYKKSEILIQVFAIFVSPDDKRPISSGLKQLLRLMIMRLNWRLFVNSARKIKLNSVDNRIYPILSLEGTKMIADSLLLLKLYLKLGAKIISLAWNEENNYAGGAFTDGIITKNGEKVLDIMYDNNIILDVSHLNEKSFYHATSYYNGKVMASHSCCNALIDHPRNLTDKQIKLIIKLGGFIGVNFYPEFLVGKGSDATSADIVNHIKHICSLGGINNVGFGSDFSGINYTPTDMQDCTTFNVLYEQLKKSGFSEQELEKICYKNFYDFYFNKI